MSVFQNALRSRSTGESVDRPSRDPLRSQRRGLPAEQVIGIAAGAIALGFLAVALPMYWVARQTATRHPRARPPATPMVQTRSPDAASTQPPDQHVGSAYVHNNLGVAYLLARRLDDAAAQLKVALALDSGNIESLVNLALVQQAAGRTAEARDLLRRAVAQDPHHAGSHYNLAVVADEGRDIVTAVTHYRAFLRYGAVAYPDLAARVRSRLASLESG